MFNKLAISKNNPNLEEILLSIIDKILNFDFYKPPKQSKMVDILKKSIAS